MNSAPEILRMDVVAPEVTINRRIHLHLKTHPGLKPVLLKLPRWRLFQEH